MRTKSTRSSPIISEKLIEKSILQWLSVKGIKAWKNHSVGIFDPRQGQFRAIRGQFTQKGTADILGILPDGKFLAIEVKSEKGRVTDEQAQFIDDILHRNGFAIIARSLDEVIAAVTAYLDEMEVMHVMNQT